MVLGAGSAGCVLANRLSADGSTVAVIEAGGRDRHPYIHIPAAYARLLDHPRLAWEVLRWVVQGKGVLTWSPGMMSLFARTSGATGAAPDVQINGGPISWAEGRIGVPEREPGFTLGVWQCRPESRGSVTLASADPRTAPIIAPRHLSALADQDCVLRGLRLARR